MREVGGSSPSSPTSFFLVPGPPVQSPLADLPIQENIPELLNLDTILTFGPFGESAVLTADDPSHLRSAELCRRPGPPRVSLPVPDPQPFELRAVHRTSPPGSGSGCCAPRSRWAGRVPLAGSACRILAGRGPASRFSGSTASWRGPSCRRRWHNISWTVPRRPTSIFGSR